MLGSAFLALSPAAAQTQGQGQGQGQGQIEVDFTALGSSNAFLLADDERATFAGEVVARSSGTTAIDSRTTLEVAGRLGYRHYSRRYGDFFTGRTSGALRHRRNEYVSFDSEAFYERYLPAEFLDETADAAIDPVGIRENYGLAQSLAWTPDARTTLQARVGWARNRPTTRSPLPDTSVLDFTLGVDRRVSPFLSLGAEAQYAIGDTRFELDRSVRAFRLTANQRLRDDWRAEAAVGVEQELVETLTGPPETGPDPGGDPGRGSGRDIGPVRFSGSGLFCYEPARTSVCVTAALRSVASGVGLRRELSAGVTAERQVSERGTASLAASYRRTPFSTIDANADVLVVRSGYEHRPGRRFRLLGGLDYLRRSQPLGGQIDAIAGRIGISFREDRR